MVVEEKECQENKIICFLDTDEKIDNILMRLSSFKSMKINRVFKSISLVSAFYIFSLAFYSYLFSISFAWVLLLLSTKAQYVYYKSTKSTDGSWSMMDADILAMYQYDYESKEAANLEKTSW